MNFLRKDRPIFYKADIKPSAGGPGVNDNEYWRTYNAVIYFVSSENCVSSMKVLVKGCGSCRRAVAGSLIRLHKSTLPPVLYCFTAKEWDQVVTIQTSRDQEFVHRVLELRDGKLLTLAENEHLLLDNLNPLFDMGTVDIDDFVGLSLDDIMTQLRRMFPDALNFYNPPLNDIPFTNVLADEPDAVVDMSEIIPGLVIPEFGDEIHKIISGRLVRTTIFAEVGEAMENDVIRMIDTSNASRASVNYAQELIVATLFSMSCLTRDMFLQSTVGQPVTEFPKEYPDASQQKQDAFMQLVSDDRTQRMATFVRGYATMVWASLCDIHAMFAEHAGAQRAGGGGLSGEWMKILRAWMTRINREDMEPNFRENPFMFTLLDRIPVQGKQVSFYGVTKTNPRLQYAYAIAPLVPAPTRPPNNQMGGVAFLPFVRSQKSLKASNDRGAKKLAKTRGSEQLQQFTKNSENLFNIWTKKAYKVYKHHGDKLSPNYVPVFGQDCDMIVFMMDQLFNTDTPAAFRWMQRDNTLRKLLSDNTKVTLTTLQTLACMQQVVSTIARRQDFDDFVRLVFNPAPLSPDSPAQWNIKSWVVLSHNNLAIASILDRPIFGMPAIMRGSLVAWLRDKRIPYNMHQILAERTLSGGYAQRLKQLQELSAGVAAKTADAETRYCVTVYEMLVRVTRRKLLSMERTPNRYPALRSQQQQRRIPQRPSSQQQQRPSSYPSPPLVSIMSPVPPPL